MGKKDDEKKIDGSLLYDGVKKLVITHADARIVAEKYFAQAKSKKRGVTDGDARDAAANDVISHYSNLAALVGGAAGLTGIIPGLGTIVATTGGALADSVACMKLQVDMCSVLVQLYDVEVTQDDAQYLSFLLAAGAAIERAGGEAAIRIGSKAGVKLLQRYLRGATLQIVKELFKKLGITFTRKAVEKAIPFGVGVLVGAGFNKALTRYVGRSAKKALSLYGTVSNDDNDEVDA